MLGLHVVLVALRGRLTISIKQDNRIGDTKYNILVSGWTLHWKPKLCAWVSMSLNFLYMRSL